MTRSALPWRIGSKTDELNSAIEWAVWLTRDSGRPAASALGIAPIRGRLATTWTISARNRRARIRSIRFCSVVPPPETHTASRIGGLVIGGVRVRNPRSRTSRVEAGRDKFIMTAQYWNSKSTANHAHTSITECRVLCAWPTLGR